MFRTAGPITYAVAVFMAVLCPIILTVLVVLGSQELEIEKNMDEVWVRTGSDFTKDKKYWKENLPPVGDSSLLLGIAVARDGGNMASKSNLLTMYLRMLETTNLVVTVGGRKFTWEDVCAQKVSPYTYPCMRYTVLDCFKEGNYDYKDAHAEAWRNMMIKDTIEPMIQPTLVKLFPHTAVGMMGFAYDPIYCRSRCTQSKIPFMGGLPPWNLKEDYTWEDSTDCKQCVTQAYGAADASARSNMYFQASQNMWTEWDKMPATRKLTNGQTVDMLKFKFWVGTANEVWERVHLDMARAELMKNLGLERDGQMTRMTPYDWVQPGRPETYRPWLREKGLKETTIMSAITRQCWNWDLGVSANLPESNKYLTLGGTDPPLDDFPSYAAGGKIARNVKAMQNIFPFAMPEEIRQRVKLGWRHQYGCAKDDTDCDRGGPIDNLSLAQAEELLKRFKEEMEKTFSKDWESGGDVQFTAWSDAIGVDGTTSRTLEDVTIKAFRQAAFFYGAIIIMSVFFFIDFFDPLTQSRCVLVFFGAAEVVLGMSAAIAITALMDMKIGVATSYTMPFILVGILCDDMYMLALSMDLVERAITPEDRWIQAMRNVGLPITVTSAINFGIFCVLYIVSDLPAITDIGTTGMVATATLYITLMVSYSVLVYFDLLRRTSGRYEFLCCIRAKPKANAGSNKRKSGIFKEKEKLSIVFERCYSPSMRSYPVRLVIILVTIILIVVGAVGIGQVEIGMDMEEMFPDDSQEFLFVKNRMANFPVWPTTMYWGALNYRDPQIQMRMVQQWEQVTSTKFIVPGAQSNSVWIAAMAEWGVDKANTGPCKAEWVKNDLGLKLKEAGGYCQRDYSNHDLPWRVCRTPAGCCPVWNFLQKTDDEFAYCIETWSKSGSGMLRTSPGFKMDMYGVKPTVPIMGSKAGADVLFAYNLFDNKDYIDLLEETRKYTDDSSLHSWMGGVAYDYFEQYLTLEKFVLTIGGVAMLSGFVLSFLFLMAEFTINKLGKVPQRMVSAFVGAFLITLCQGVSMTTVLGLSSLAGIQLSSFTALSCLLSSGFAIEYSCHVVHHFCEAQESKAVDRAIRTMEFLFVPTAMSFFSSAISVIPLALSGFRFVTRYFFVPLLFVVLVTYWFGAWALPFFLSLLDCMPLLEKKSMVPAEAQADVDAYNEEVARKTSEAEEEAAQEPQQPEVPEEPPEEIGKPVEQDEV